MGCTGAASPHGQVGSRVGCLSLPLASRWIIVVELARPRTGRLHIAHRLLSEALRELADLE